MMARIKRILLATDFSDCAVLAQEHAMFLAKTSGAGLDVVHVIELYPGLDPAYPVNHLSWSRSGRKPADSLRRP
jgi:nucleotide-binding universal stress UspA family protein